MKGAQAHGTTTKLAAYVNDYMAHCIIVLWTATDGWFEALCCIAMMVSGFVCCSNGMKYKEKYAE